MAPDLTHALAATLDGRRRAPAARALLVGLSGIDGSGKGYTAARLARALRSEGLAVAGINVDGWLELPARRFSAARPAEHFYEHALRLEEMFERFVLPLRDKRSIRLVADYAEETATEFRKHLYHFEGVDVVLVEGIFLFKRRYRPHFDLACWVECSFETALRRALARAQEGLPPAETARAYQAIYFPAQRLHFGRDDPRASADLLIVND